VSDTDSLPSEQLQRVLESFGVPRRSHARRHLLRIISESCDGWFPEWRSTNELAQIVVNLGREGRIASLEAPARSYRTAGRVPKR
jgi:hypothetical protein